METYKDIEAYRVGPLLGVTDFLFVFPFLEYLRRRKTSSMRLDLGGGDTPWQSEADRRMIREDLRGGATFLTNHRDIIMDAAWLSFLLRMRYWIRPYMGIGNNLLSKRWIEWLVRYLRCYVVVRDGGPKEVMKNAQHLSAYIQMLRGKGKSIWLAQREGRAKDGNDLTQPAVLKMLTMGSGDFLDAIRKLNICPVSINYEFDPCDYLKAREMQLRRDDPQWKKPKGEDELSMKTGIFGEKGRVVYRITPSLNHWMDAHLNELEKMTRNEQVQAVAKQIDYQIHIGYETYERGEAFEQYLQERLAMIEMANKDEAYLMDKLHEMYRNPVLNHQAAKEKKGL
ncbi:MAG: 1-acyl-sn-glycerol-3-phosphate acyltransferase [Paludibacteraceae bacterium]|nr:1-acyl-sn-glycerol-3-phosphate acyltransferase [Paludibacteraceae bacterium]